MSKKEEKITVLKQYISTELNFRRKINFPLTRTRNFIDFTVDHLTTFEIQKYDKNKKILQIVWKYLTIEDKLKCTLVCKQFNSFVTSKNCFNLNIDMRLTSIPILSRHYTTICIKHEEFYRLDPLVLQMLKNLSRNVIFLKLMEILTDLKTLSELLNEFPYLKSLEMIGIELKDEELSLKDKPNLLILKKLKIELGWFPNISKTILSLFDSATKIQSISLFKARLEINEFNNFLEKHKNSLESFDINLCKFYIHSKKSESEFSSFDRLYQLRKLYLINNNEKILKVLKSKCYHLLTDFELKYHSTEKEKVKSFLLGYMLDKNINELQLIEYSYKKYKEPIIVKSIVSKYYHIHYCSSNTRACDHEKCKLVPLTNLETNLNRNEDLFLFLSIKVRKNVKDFEKLKCNESNIINEEIDDEIMIKIQEYHQEKNKIYSTTIEEQELILNTAWKYLNIKDKLKCTRVCKMFNSFISSKDCFSFKINMKLIGKTNIPILSRDYKRVFIKGHEFDYLEPEMILMLEQFSGSVINLDLNLFQSNVLTLCCILNELPLVESLTLTCMYLNIDDLSIVNLPKFLHLRTLKISSDISDTIIGAILAIFSSAQNLQSLELEFFILDINELNSFLKRHKNNLNSISFRLCRIKGIDSENDLNIFDFLHQLRVLKLIYSNTITTKILASKCIHSLTDLEIIFDDYKEILNPFLLNYFKLKEINENQLIEYEAKNCKEPIITKTKCPDSDNIITTSHHVHYCKLKYQEYMENDHNKCKSIPLTNLRSNSIRDESRCSYLSIKVT